MLVINVAAAKPRSQTAEDWKNPKVATSLLQEQRVYSHLGSGRKNISACLHSGCFGLDCFYSWWLITLLSGLIATHVAGQGAVWPKGGSECGLKSALPHEEPARKERGQQHHLPPYAGKACIAAVCWDGTFTHPVTPHCFITLFLRVFHCGRNKRLCSKERIA